MVQIYFRIVSWTSVVQRHQPSGVVPMAYNKMGVEGSNNFKDATCVRSISFFRNSLRFKAITIIFIFCFLHLVAIVGSVSLRVGRHRARVLRYVIASVFINDFFSD